MLHGMFSSPEEFLARDDPLANPMPLQLVDDGYDVWIGCTRGREYTLGHSIFTDTTIPDQSLSYWNFTYEEIGKEDITSMVDTIILNRVGTCEKVQIIGHGTGSSSALVAATDPLLMFADKVGQIVPLAPCIVVNIENFWLTVRDVTSIEAFYASLAEFGVYSMFSAGLDPNLEAYCNSGGVNTIICNVYIKPNLDNTLLRLTSLKDFEHVQ